MKLRDTFLLALGVAVPLWIRQYRFEQGVVAEVSRFTDATVSAHTRTVHDVNKALTRFVEELGGER